MSLDRGYELPDLIPGESNGDWLKRAVDTIPAEIILAQMINRMYRKWGWNRTWSFIGEATAHGSGVSGQIIRRFLTEENRKLDKP